MARCRSIRLELIRGVTGSLGTFRGSRFELIPKRPHASAVASIKESVAFASGSLVGIALPTHNLNRYDARRGRLSSIYDASGRRARRAGIRTRDGCDNGALGNGSTLTVDRVKRRHLRPQFGSMLVSCIIRVGIRQIQA
jgi:hypothetical protein